MLLGLGLILAPGLGLPARLGVAALLVAIQLLGVAKGRLRSIAAREQFPEEAGNLKCWGSCYWRLAPLVPWVMLYNFVLAGFVRRIEWRGTVYELRSMNEVRVLRRDL